jgi:hypothetical protein
LPRRRHRARNVDARQASSTTATSGLSGGNHRKRTQKSNASRATKSWSAPLAQIAAEPGRRLAVVLEEGG